MKTEDFERLKAVCEKEGFELLKSLPDKDVNFHILAVSKKDIWNGVDYFSFNGFHMKIMNSVTDKLLYNSKGDSFWKDECKPSNESAYIEQLKKEAFERFGEIKDGDRFDRSKMEFNIPQDVDRIFGANNGFKYYKDCDQFFFGNTAIYNQGKWATRVKERVEVDIDQKCWAIISKGKQEIELTFLISKPVPCIEAMKTFLASQLEDYLNK